MVKSNVISANNANRLYWLGRYEERVHMTLHLLRKCYDAMIDGQPEQYNTFWQRLDAVGNYKTTEEFTLGMMYDEENPASVISAQTFARDNAMLLRGFIASETLGYLEMSLALLKRLKEKNETNITELQPVTDWSMAFWGSVDERTDHRRPVVLMYLGRKVECIDMLVRFDYPFDRVQRTFRMLLHFLEGMNTIYDPAVMDNIESMLTPETYNPTDPEYKNKLLQFLNILIRV